MARRGVVLADVDAVAHERWRLCDGRLNEPLQAVSALRAASTSSSQSVRISGTALMSLRV